MTSVSCSGTMRKTKLSLEEWTLIIRFFKAQNRILSHENDFQVFNTMGESHLHPPTKSRLTPFPSVMLQNCVDRRIILGRWNYSIHLSYDGDDAAENQIKLRFAIFTTNTSSQYNSTIPCRPWRSELHLLRNQGDTDLRFNPQALNLNGLQLSC